MDMCAIMYQMAGFLQPTSYSSKVYKEINSYKYAVVHKPCKWESIFDKGIPLNVFLKYIANLYKVTNVTKYRNFQYRFLMFNIYTNVKLYKWKILSTELCSFCHMFPETILHLLYECFYVKKYWAEITQYIYQLTNQHHDITFEKVVFVKVVKLPMHIINLVILIAKQNIFCFQCSKGKLSVSCVKSEIQFIKKY